MFNKLIEFSLLVLNVFFSGKKWTDYSRAYNRTLTLYMVEYASVAYIEEVEDIMAWNCSRCRGLTEGFQPFAYVNDESRQLQGYVGVSEALKSVVVAFRGTHLFSIVNWVSDLRFLELNLSYPGVTNAMVHGGFYSAYHRTTIRDKVVSAVISILEERPELSVSVTGHSLGAALAALCALDLKVNWKLPRVEIVTFGQPRLGNKPFAEFYELNLPKNIRMTHSHDPVVHLPPEGQAGSVYSYHHIATEVWIHAVEIMKHRWFQVEQVCDSSGEDPSCSRSVTGNSVADHLQYLGIPLWGKEHQEIYKGIELSSSSLSRKKDQRQY